MDLDRLDGRGVVSDVRLADLPVARDDGHLNVVDYGPAGRRVGSQDDLRDVPRRAVR
jgi:hypothetical protein